MPNLWDHYGLRGVAFLVLALFVLFRGYQLLFKHRELRRERLRANFLGQLILGLILTVAALVLCDARVIGLPHDFFGFAPPDESGVANVVSLSRGPKKPAINWGGVLAGVERDIDAGNWEGAAQKLLEPRRNGLKEALIICSWDPYTQPLAKAFSSLGRSAIEKGDKLKARLYLGAAVDMAPDADSYILKASLADPEEWKQTLDDLERAARRSKPGDLRAVEQRLQIRLKHIDTERRGALSDADALLAARPSDTALLVLRAKLRLELAAVDGAIADLESATRTRTTDLPARLLLAEARVQKGTPADLKKAVAELEPLLRDLKESGSTTETFKGHLLRARARQELGQPGDALPDASKAVQLDPKSAEAYYIRGRVELDLDKRSAAREDFDKAIQLDPKHRRAVFWHGILIYQKDPKQGLNDFNNAVALEPDGWAHYYRGECLLLLKRVDEAQTAFTEAQVLGKDEKLLKLAKDGMTRAQKR